MNGLLNAISTKIASSTAFFQDVGGRIFLDVAPEGTPFPYCVITIVDDPSANTFTEKIDETTIQFSLYSTSKSVVEISTMYTDLKALFDNGSLTITGNTFLSCERKNMSTTAYQETTKEGTETVKQWDVDYLIRFKEGT